MLHQVIPQFNFYAESWDDFSESLCAGKTLYSKAPLHVLLYLVRDSLLFQL